MKARIGFFNRVKVAKEESAKQEANASKGKKGKIQSNVVEDLSVTSIVMFIKTIHQNYREVIS